MLRVAAEGPFVRGSICPDVVDGEEQADEWGGCWWSLCVQAAFAEAQQVVKDSEMRELNELTYPEFIEALLRSVVARAGGGGERPSSSVSVLCVS